MTRFLKNTLGAGFLTLAVSTPVLGDPILVTDGTIEFISAGGGFAGARIDISGTQGFSLSGVSDSVVGLGCGLCLPGEMGSHSGIVFGVSGTGTLNGATYPFNPSTGGTGMLTIAAPPFTLPPTADVREATFQTLFALTPLSFFEFRLSDLDPNAFRLDVAGSGRATGRFILIDEPTGYLTQGITYEFDSPAAVPEPASLLLVGGGLAALWARRRRARNVTR